jgi:magnesium-transporting ATPase (P-type)
LKPENPNLTFTICWFHNLVNETKNKGDERSNIMPPKASEADIEKDSKTPGADDPQWHAMTKEEAAAQLRVSPNIRHEGLTTEEAKARLEEYGYNQLTEKEKVTLLQRIWKQVNNVLVGILVFVAVVSLMKGIISEDGEDKVTNFIEVGLITFVIT